MLVTHEPDIAEYGTRIVAFRDGPRAQRSAGRMRRRAEHEHAAMMAQVAEDALSA